MGLQNSNRIQRRHKSYIAPAGEQARPITGFYAEILKKARSQVTPLTRTDPNPPPPESLPKTQKEQTLEKARIVFGSKLAGPAERRKEITEASQIIAGVTVPPKPSEPDNCCMSGCVNCVWDFYRDDMEEWAEKSAQARAAMQAQRQKGEGTGSMVAGSGQPSHVAVSMDDDGGGSETNWIAGAEQAHLFDDIPVGIREFMRTEKKLKQMHKKEEAATA
ncbi:uncharacterized protein K460DRAFT_409520 [Cucurbitaria berberidis CBS 394.84]|uniref:Oxidoreductase-like domain-containing protein n=1 Tax=Cucurbitaria berberidis CBS 394.84 TaxID=1168544 RepID=A0A9P4L5L0_9PLEO|nr:uncharacterized protein K460DRAFT_409520 [Cucurbitaria berberidis CBS 394.84]KAF1842093.1 hypothetical protein K460DRAFT_409520 [Cucurbitaria berberidis CBS 394.84]